MTWLHLVDLTGRVWLSESLAGRIARVDIPAGIPAIFLLKVVFTDGTVINRKIVQPE